MSTKDAAEVVAKRRQEWEKGRRVCRACGSASQPDKTALGGFQYRILRGGMHVGNVELTAFDPICRFCDASGQVKS